MPTKQPVLQQVQDLLQQRFAKSMFANTEVLTNLFGKQFLNHRTGNPVTCALPGHSLTAYKNARYKWSSFRPLVLVSLTYYYASTSQPINLVVFQGTFAIAYET